MNSAKWADIAHIGAFLRADSARKRTAGEAFCESSFYEDFSKEYDPYPAWNSSAIVPVRRQEIEAAFVVLTDTFGFQSDNTKNMFDYLMRLLDSRASRMGPELALLSLHADYIGGVNSNYRKWVFAAQLHFDEFAILKNKAEGEDKPPNPCSTTDYEKYWVRRMDLLLAVDRVTQIALYLLCWGEASNIRFMPECLCFIYKCCSDYYSMHSANAPRPPAPFLDHIIVPLYNYYRDQSYHWVDGNFGHNGKDHDSIVGYDDMNQLFWYKQGLHRIVLDDSTSKLMAVSPDERYNLLGRVAWDKCFSKTFKERRSWSHVVVNFNRVWVIHVAVFWYYTAFNSPTLYTKNYRQEIDNQPHVQTRLSVMSQAASIALVICLFGTAFELTFVPREWAGALRLLSRSVVLSLTLIVNVVALIFIFWQYLEDVQSKVGLIVSISQFVLLIITVMYLAITPLDRLFSMFPDLPVEYSLPAKQFTAGFYSLKGTDRIASYGLWITIFVSKFVESYFFLTLSLKDTVRELSSMKVLTCPGDAVLGNYLCYHHPSILLGLIYCTDLVLFFLDTYLWYIIWNTVFSVCRSFHIGVSIWTPWRNIFSRLPKRIYSKIIASLNEKNIKAKLLVSQVWNSIIISMYREHLLSLDHVQKLIYKHVAVPGKPGDSVLKEPIFFLCQDDQSMKSAIFHEQSEAQRRITFFAQSLATPMPEVGPVSMMPSFTVLVPHYGEKITLSLREIIREEERYSNLTMLEYLKQLHPLEWECFVKDTKLLAEELECETSEYDGLEHKDDFPYYSVGYKIATPEYILRTRIWASLRSQTLYRTIAGFMNYARAIKLLYDVENPDACDKLDEYAKLEEASVMALRKFRMVVSMQRLEHFSPEESENKDFLMRAYPELQICYLEQCVDEETGGSTYYSSLVDGSCAITEDTERRPKIRVRLPGNPILGDGKSDNQNNAIIFCRGEYTQLVDANQDNYLEECLKIRSVLAEFEELVPPSVPYQCEIVEAPVNPVAIIGTREYIFSENVGVLGDVAAGKEQTFGTLFARTLAHIGGKLHYGHPDFLNNIFMCTRGGVSKAQKGLHLNEDIYAGMNALMRGGRIKHCEYMQCGKGRDLGFGSISSFTMKIGAGMGEQTLSREYFYLGTKLPLDRFLSFYYAHPGFHLNNVFIMLSIKLFLIVAINLAALANTSVVCEYNKFSPITDPRYPLGCYNLVPIVGWLKRCVYSIFLVFLISFVPLVVQELTERGLYKALSRLGKHFASFSPLFEIFVCRIYAHSLVSDITVGGARYIATGRGLATKRVAFSGLYSRFASETLLFGAMAGIMILYCSIGMWIAPLIYFWFTVMGLLVSPFLYNPNQFSWNEFFSDYRDFLRWLHRGNLTSCLSSWINFTRLERSRTVGLKGKIMHSSEVIRSVNDAKPLRWHIVVTELVSRLTVIFFAANAYLYANAQADTTNELSNGFIRLVVVTMCPIIANMIILFVFFIFSIMVGPMTSLIFKEFSSVLATLVHLLCTLNYVFFALLLCYLQNWNVGRTVLGYGVSFMTQELLIKITIATFVSREFRHDRANRSWWSGKWLAAGLGIRVFTQPLREYMCKIGEMSYFARDLFLGHFLLFAQFPLLLIPFIDKWHSMMLFWLRPGKQLRPRLLSKKQRHKRRVVVYTYFVVFLLAMMVNAAILSLPWFLGNVLRLDIDLHMPLFILRLKQPVDTVSGNHGLQKHGKDR